MRKQAKRWVSSLLAFAMAFSLLPAAAFGNEGQTNTGGMAVTSVTYGTYGVTDTVYSALAVKTAPKKTSYSEGQALDLTGLSVTLSTYGNSQTVVSYADFAQYGLTAAPANGTVLAPADKAVTIAHAASGLNATQKLTVTAKVASIAIKTPPKTVYYETEKLALGNLVLTLIRSDGTTMDVNYRQVTSTPAHGTGLTMADKSVVFSVVNADGTTEKAVQLITVNPKVDIKVSSEPNKVEYVKGDKLDLTGLKLSLVTSSKTDGSSAPLEIGLSELAAHNIAVEVLNGSTVLNSDWDQLELPTGRLTVRFTHKTGGGTAYVPVLVKGTTHGLANGFYTADVYGWHETNDSPSAMAGTLGQRAWLEVVDGKLFATIRYQKANIFGIEINGESIREVYPETRLSGSELVEGAGLKGMDSGDGSRSFRIELATLDYPRLGYNIYLFDAPFMKTISRLKFENVVKQASAPVPVTKLEVKTPPAQTTYYAANTLNLEGIVLVATREDNSQFEIPYQDFHVNGIAAYPQNKSMLSEKDTAVSLTVLNSDGKSIMVNQPIQVRTYAPEAVKAMKLTAGLNTSIYAVGGQFSYDGLKVALVMEDGEVEANANNLVQYGLELELNRLYKFSETDKSRTQVVLMHTATGKRLELPIQVRDASQVVRSVQIKAPPAKVQYKQGEQLDLTGLVVTVTKADNTKEDVSLQDFDKYELKTNLANAQPLTLEDTVLDILFASNINRLGSVKLTVEKSDEPEPGTDTGALKDGIYTVDVQAWNEASDKASMMAGLMDKKAQLEVMNGTIYATVTFIAGKIMTIPVSGKDVAEVWPIADATVSPKAGTGIKGTVDQATGSQSFRFKIGSLSFPFLKINVVSAAMKSITGIRLNFDEDTLVRVGDLPTNPTNPQEPDWSKPVKLPAEVIEASQGNEVKVAQDKLQSWLDQMPTDVKAAAAVEIMLPGTADAAVQNAAVMIPAAVLEAKIKEEGVTGLQLAKQAVSDADKQGVIAALLKQKTDASETKLLYGFDLKLQQLLGTEEVREVHQLGGKIKISISLSEAQAAALAKGTPKLFYYNPELQALENVEASFDASTGTISFNTDHLSVYAVAVAEAAGTPGTPGNGTPGTGTPGSLDPSNLSDGVYTISAKAIKELNEELSMSNGMIYGRLGLAVSAGTIHVTLIMQGTEAYPLKEVKALWYRDASGSYVEASKEYTESGNALTFRFPVESITKYTFMKVEVPMITDAMGTLPIFRLAFDTSTLQRGETPSAPTSPTPAAAESFVIKAEAGEGGTISPNGDVKVAKGKSQEFKFKANEGYKIKHVIVDGKSVGNAESYTFENVVKAATISVSFEKIKAATPEQKAADPVIDPSKIVFDDTTGHWAERSIQLVVSKGLFNGINDKEFAPNITMTRGMLVTVLGRMAKVNVAGYMEVPFMDVDPQQYYAPYIAWAADQNLVSGIGDGSFAPEQFVTREQLAVIFAKYAKFAGVDLAKVNANEKAAAEAFSDNESISSWAKASVEQVQKAGIVQGKENNRFDPAGTATRAEVAAILVRMLDMFAAKAK